jgi:hypothetical protein
MPFSSRTARHSAKTVGRTKRSAPPGAPPLPNWLRFAHLVYQALLPTVTGRPRNRPPRPLAPSPRPPNWLRSANPSTKHSCPTPPAALPPPRPLAPGPRPPNWLRSANPSTKHSCPTPPAALPPPWPPAPGPRSLAPELASFRKSVHEAFLPTVTASTRPPAPDPCPSFRWNPRHPRRVLPHPLQGHDSMPNQCNSPHLAVDKINMLSGRQNPHASTCMKPRQIKLRKAPLFGPRRALIQAGKDVTL